MNKYYVEPLYCVKQYKEGNCPLDDVESSIKSALEQESIAFAEWCTDRSERIDNEEGAAVWVDRELEKYPTAELYRLYKEFKKQNP